MKLPRWTLARIVRAFGTLLLSTSALAFLAWIQSRDPECVFDDVGQGMLLQLRMCETDIDTVQAAPWWQLAVVVAVALLGWLCLRFTRRRMAALRRVLSGSGSRAPRGPC